MPIEKRLLGVIKGIFMSCLITSSAIGFDFASNPGKIPVEIDAQNGIECEQQENKCIARGQVKVSQGSTLLQTDQLTAYFAKSTPGVTQQKLSRLEARGHVVISSTEKSQKLYADQSFYNMETGEATFTGNNLRLILENMTVTAQDALHYYEKKQEAVAKGNATVTRNNQTIQADELHAFLEKDAQGKMIIQRVVAQGHVVITTPKEIIQSQQGIYTHAQQLIHLEGDVRISHTHGKDGIQLTGEFAEVNLATGKSRLLTSKPGTTPGRRVKVLLIPNS